MKNYTFTITRSAAVDPIRVHDLLRDATTWADWAGRPITVSRWESPPSDSDDFTGAVRLLGAPQFQAREQVTVDERPTVHGYRVLANWPVRDYHATVRLTPTDDGTRLEWSGSFTERIPVTGRLWLRYLDGFLGKLADRVLAHAAQPTD